MNSFRTRQSGSARRHVLAAAVAALALIAVLVFLALKGTQQPPAGAPVANEIGLPAPPKAVDGAPEGRKEGQPGAAMPAASTASSAEKAAPQETPGASLSGSVRVAGADRPAPGMMVVVRRETPGDNDIQARFQKPKIEDGDRSAASAADGRYLIEGIPPGEYRAFALRGDTAFVAIPPLQGKRLMVGADLAAQKVDFEVDLGGTIYGKVLDVEENPVAGAKVSCPSLDFLTAMFDADSTYLINDVVSGADGAYRIAGLPPERSYQVMVDAKDKSKHLSEQIDFTPDEMEIELDIVLLPGSTISGRVVGQDGRPVQGVETRIVAETDNLLLLENRSSTTDASGAFKFERVPAGSYSLDAGERTRGETALDFECDGESEVTDLVLVLSSSSPTGEALTGRVVDDGGNGIPGVKLQLAGFAPSSGPISKAATSKEDGSFTFESLSGGMFNLNADHEKYAPFVQVGVAPGPTPLEVRMERVARIRGTVITAAGDPVAGAAIKVAPISKDLTDFSRFMSGQLSGQKPAVKSGADGAFVVDKVTPGRNRIRTEASGFAPSVSEIDLAPGREVADLEIKLSEGGSIVGVVLSPDGLPIADARLTAVEAPDNPMEDMMKRFMPAGLSGAKPAGARTESDGTFKINHLPEAKFNLSATHVDFSPSEDLSISLKPEEKRAGVKLRLRKLSAIKVRVREKQKPLPNLMVQLMGPISMRMATTDEEGRSEFSGLPPGDYLIQAMDVAKMAAGKGLSVCQRTAQIIEGQSMDLDIVQGIGAKVRGKVIGKLGGAMNVIIIHRPEAPKAEEMNPADFQSNFRAAQYNVAMAFIANDGTYTISDVPDGEFILEIPSMPSDLAKLSQMTPKDREPHVRKPIRVEGGRDVTMPDLRLKSEQEGSEAPESKPTPQPAATSGE